MARWYITSAEVEEESPGKLVVASTPPARGQRILLLGIDVVIGLVGILILTSSSSAEWPAAIFCLLYPLILPFIASIFVGINPFRIANLEPALILPFIVWISGRVIVDAGTKTVTLEKEHLAGMGLSRRRERVIGFSDIAHVRCKTDWLVSVNNVEMTTNDGLEIVLPFGRNENEAKRMAAKIGNLLGPPVALEAGLTADAHAGLGWTYYQQDELDKALEEFQEAVRLDPDSRDARLGLGWIYHFRGESDKSIPEFQAAIRVNPDMAGAYLGLGSAYSDLGKFGQAAEAFHEAIRLDPGLAEAYYGLGELYSNQGNPDKAVPYYEKAIELKMR